MSVQAMVTQEERGAGGGAEAHPGSHPRARTEQTQAAQTAQHRARSPKRRTVRVDDRDHLAAARSQVLLHALGVGEQGRVPRHVALADGVLDVEP